MSLRQRSHNRQICDSAVASSKFVLTDKLRISALRYMVCLAWPFAWWCKPTFLNCLFRGIVEDDPEGPAPY